MRTRLVIISAALVLLAGVDAFAVNDWDLYMLRMVNRARIDPAGEDARIGSSTGETADPVDPLAYHLLIGDSATNHNNWMHDNLGSGILSTQPDSFTHYETLDGTAGGTPATGTPSYTGVNIGDRITAAGFTWGRAGENILVVWAGGSIPIDQARMDENHKGWWESGGHRANMLYPDFSVFGHMADTRTVTGNPGVPSWTNNLHYATQNFGRSLYTPYTHIFGLLYDDKDTSGDWTPHDDGNPLCEGLEGVNFQVFDAGTSTEVATGVTMDNGAFTVNIGNGAYDVVFTDSALPAGVYRLLGITLDGSNVDAGDLNVFPTGDLDGSGFVGQNDLDIVLGVWEQEVEVGSPPDPSGDGFVGQEDLDIVLGDWGEGTPPIPTPEPTTVMLLTIGGFMLIRRRRIA